MKLRMKGNLHQELFSSSAEMPVELPNSIPLCVYKIYLLIDLREPFAL